jgi:hypothetical protein
MDKDIYDIHEVNEDVVINKDHGIQFYHPDYRALISNAVENAIINILHLT